MSEAGEQGPKRTPFSAKLPQVALNHAVPIVEALSALGGPASPPYIAQQLDTTPSSSLFRTKIAAAGYYGLVRVDGERRTLTERGEALTGGNEEEALQARREAVMSTSFGPLIYSLRGRTVSEATVSLRLQNDLQVPEASARSIAKALMASASDASLLTGDGRFDTGAIEGASSVIPTATDNGSMPRSATTQRQPTKTQTPTPKADAPKTDPPPEDKEPRPFGCSVQVVVNVDASNLTPQQIAELVRELQQNPKS